MLWGWCNESVFSPQRLRTIFVCLLYLSLTFSASAEWLDPLDTPAAPTSKAHQTLLLDITRADESLVAVGAMGNIIYSSDHGNRWHQASVPVSVTLTAVFFADAQTGWSVGHDGVILHTNNGGETWERQFDGFSANQAIIIATKKQKEMAEQALNAAQGAGDQTVIAQKEEAFENALFAYEDAVYDAANDSTKPFLDVWFEDTQTGFAVGAYGMFFKTTNGGQDWVDVSALLGNSERLHLNHIHATDDGALVVVGESGFLARSEDQGDSWRRLPSPYEASLFGLLSQQNTQLLFGLRGHLYRSTDGGIQWQELDVDSEQSLMSGTNTQQGAVLVGNGGAVIFVDHEFKLQKNLVLADRKAIASVIENAQGELVLVGESGIQRLDAQGKPLSQSAVMSEEF